MTEPTMTSGAAERLAEREAEQRRALVERENNPTVTDREDRIGRALEHLEQQLEKLTDQLAPVLAEPEPVAAVAEVATPARSLHAVRLTHLAEWTERIVRDVHRLIGRVDL